MRVPLRQTGRIVLLTTLLAASFPQASLAGSAGKRAQGVGNSFVFLLSSTPLAHTHAG
jgi:hypothetical protein